MRIFIICTFYETLMEAIKSKKKCGTWNIYDRWEMNIKLWPKNLKGTDNLEDLGINNIKMDLKEKDGLIWIEE